MKKLIKYLTLLLFFSSMHYSQIRDSILTVISNSVSIDSLAKNVKVLTGETEISIDDSLTFILSRHSKLHGNVLAQKFIETKLKDYGLTTYNLGFTPLEKM